MGLDRHTVAPTQALGALRFFLITDRDDRRCRQLQVMLVAYLALMQRQGALVDTVAAEPDTTRRSIRPLLEEEETPAAFAAVHAVGDSPCLSFHSRPLQWRVSASFCVQAHIRYILAKVVEVVQFKGKAQLRSGGADAIFYSISLHQP